MSFCKFVVKYYLSGLPLAAGYQGYLLRNQLKDQLQESAGPSSSARPSCSAGPSSSDEPSSIMAQVNPDMIGNAVKETLTYPIWGSKQLARYGVDLIQQQFPQYDSKTITRLLGKKDE